MLPACKLVMPLLTCGHAMNNSLLCVHHLFRLPPIWQNPYLGSYNYGHYVNFWNPGPDSALWCNTAPQGVCTVPGN
jgi:hypothetical protein